MQPSDWVADCMVPEAWAHQPFELNGMAVATDLQSLIAFPKLGGSYEPPRFEDDTDFTTQMLAALAGARNAYVTSPLSIDGLPVDDKYIARLEAIIDGLEICTTEKAVYFHHLDPDTGELRAFGVIYCGACAAGDGL